jgi:hypothetical protein
MIDEKRLEELEHDFQISITPWASGGSNLEKAELIKLAKFGLWVSKLNLLEEFLMVSPCELGTYVDDTGPMKVYAYHKTTCKRCTIAQKLSETRHDGTEKNADRK